MNPYIDHVVPVEDHVLEVVFTNGEHRRFDITPYLHKGVFTRLQQAAAFAAVRVVAGSLEWPGGIDLSYDTVYLESTPVAAGTERAAAPAR